MRRIGLDNRVCMDTVPVTRTRPTQGGLKKLANWGNYPVIEALEESFASATELKGMLAGAHGTTRVIARGNGRCYGDSSLAGMVVSTLRHGRFLSFTESSGELACQSGVMLKEILDTFVPRGWFLSVTPGTKFITVGGAIASDVHGKNHHADGSFSRYVASMQLMLASGEVVLCSRETNCELFEATCGGMGLTGVILSATIRLRRIATAFIRQETAKARNLAEIMELFEKSATWSYSVAWIDCLSQSGQGGRSILFRGEHASPHEAGGASPLRIPPRHTINLPFFLPAAMLNGFTVRAFNAAYYACATKGAATAIVDYDAFFYPLDGILHWNRIYGRNGFVQYQFVLPKASAAKGLAEILRKISSGGQGSFLAVLKLLGKGENLISFPMEGYTMALDFPVTKKLFPLLEELDKMVIEYGGRLYLAKDSRMGAATFNAGYPNAPEFRRLRGRLDPAGIFGSLQSARLGI